MNNYLIIYFNTGVPKNKSKKKGRKGKSVETKEKEISNQKLPGAPFLLTKEELKEADENISSIRVPLGFDWRPKPFFVKYQYMKSHDWKEVQYVLFSNNFKMLI